MKKGSIQFLKIIFFLVFLVFGQIVLFGQNTDDFEFKNEHRTLTITGYKGSVKSVIIPEKINGLPVTKIGYQAFAFKQLTSVSIPDSVTYIDTAAFYNNRLTAIALPASLTFIGDIAFSFNRITNVVIPPTVKKIGYEAFSDNRLTSVALPQGVNTQLSSFYLALFDKYMRNERKESIFSIMIVISDMYEIAVLDNSVVEIVGYHGFDKDHVIPERINGLPVVAIGNRVFAQNSLSSVVIPNSVQIIGDDAFIHNELTNVVLPNSVRIIGNGAFVDNQISNLVLPDFLVSIGNAAFSSNAIAELKLPETLVNIGFAAFSSNKLKNVVIPSSVRTMGKQVFDSSVKIKKENYFLSADGQPHLYYIF